MADSRNLQTLLGVRLPIIQAPMAGVQNSALAIAVSRAGGLGSLPCAMLDAGALRAELELIQAADVSAINLNFFCHKPVLPTAAQLTLWQQRLQPYYDEWAIESDSGSAGPGRTPFNQEMAALVCAYRPTVVSFHFGLPAPELVSMIRRAGVKIISSATTIDEALWLEAHGVDAIIAQGLEAGGHRGMFLSEDISTQMGTLALLPQIVQSVQLPVIAAGGIADAEGVRAALSLGAVAAQIGTAYLLCPEAATSAVHRQALKSDQARRTALTNVFSGRPARGIMNRVMQEIGPICEQAPPFPAATAALAPLRAAAERVGCSDFSPLWAGQNASGCKEIGAGDLTRALAGLA